MLLMSYRPYKRTSSNKAKKSLRLTTENDPNSKEHDQAHGREKAEWQTPNFLTRPLNLSKKIYYSKTLPFFLRRIQKHLYNSPSPPRVDIVLFRASPQDFKMRLLGRGFHTLIKNVSFSSPTDVRISQSTHLGGPTFSPTDEESHNLQLSHLIRFFSTC